MKSTKNDYFHVSKIGGEERQVIVTKNDPTDVHICLKVSVETV